MKLGEKLGKEKIKEQKVAIIMPVYNSGPHLKAAIDSIIDNTEYGYYRLIIVCSESTDGTDELVDSYAEKHNFVTAYHTKREGITKAINYGISMTHKDEDIYLTQDDVILPNLYGKGRDWLTLMVMNSKMKDVGLVTTFGAGGIDTMGCYLRGFRWVGTWSLYIPRSTINKVGLFDEGFSPGPGDDIDYSYRVFNAGLLILETPFWVDHHRLTENFNDKEELSNKAMKFFRKKHGINKPNPAIWTQAQTFGEVTNEFQVAIPITEKGKFLDYGCGGGKDSFALNKIGIDCDGCDIVEENVVVAKHNHKKHGDLDTDIFHIELCDDIPKPKDYYDGIVCNGVLHHIPEAHLVLREFKRVLKPKGVAYIMLYTEFLYDYHKPTIKDKMFDEGKPLTRAFGECTDQCIYSLPYTDANGRKLFEDSGFKVLESKLYHDNQFRVFKIQND